MHENIENHGLPNRLNNIYTHININIICMHDNYHYYSLYTQISIYNIMLQMISRNLIYRIDKCSVPICYELSGNNCVYYINLYTSYWLCIYTVAKYNRVTIYCHRYICT